MCMTETNTPTQKQSPNTPQTETIVQQRFARVAIAVPLFQLFDYALPRCQPKHLIGLRVQVPFGPKKTVGFILEATTQTHYDEQKIRPIYAFLDTEPLLPTETLRLAQWCSTYYFFPIGETIAAMVPKTLRQGKPLERFQEYHWSLTPLGRVIIKEDLKKQSKSQQTTLQLLETHQQASRAILNSFNIKSTTLESLEKKGFIEKTQYIHKTATAKTQHQWLTELPPQLTEEQITAIDNINQTTGVHLLFGVTGSGKTEVYMTLILKILEQKQQALILIPEISLTPQTLARFSKRFNAKIAVLHSQQSDHERTHQWLSASSGLADIIIGTRSAVLTPIPRLGLIILDEEHDQSYKQQDGGMRYSARDLALLRAHWAQISVVLGSATPSLETLYTVQKNNTLDKNKALNRPYLQHNILTRATGVPMPQLALIDLRREATTHGIANTILNRIEKTLQEGLQVLVFLNRRGFAPAVICNDCGWIANCPRCDAKLTMHRQSLRLICHHCEYQCSIPEQCPLCHSIHLNAHGKGTERVEDTLKTRFNVPIIRVDRDTMPNQRAFQRCLDQVNTGQPMILLGTQILSKGHDFHGIHLVVMLDMDGGLFSSDFRAEEKTSQLLAQVTGRAGRGTRAGQVVLQTHQPHHPVFQYWIEHNFQQTAQYLLSQRRDTGLPPYSYHTVLRAEANRSDIVKDFLIHGRDCFLQLLTQTKNNPKKDNQIAQKEIHNTTFEHIQVFGPVNATMERRAGMHRYHLLLQGHARKPLHQLIRLCYPILNNHRNANRIRWSFEIDPQDF